jgi:hypothetical protein
MGVGVFDEVVKNKEELMLKFFNILQGREAKTKLMLDGIELDFGKGKIKVDGSVELTFTPLSKKK